MIDRRLLEVENYIDHVQSDYRLNDLAEKLQISERQLVRQLNNWQEAGYIEYIPGKGRGNKVEIIMKQSVEQETLKDILSRLNELSMEEIQTYIDFPWSSKSVHEIKKLLRSYLVDEEAVYTEYLPSLPESIHPAFIATSIEAQIAYQLFESLYRVSKTGEIKRNLLRYDEWQDNQLHLYLKKDIYFSNGTLLTSVEVRNTLKKLMTDSLYTSLFTIIEGITIVSDDYLILSFKARPKFFEYTLASRYSAIYKELGENQIVGTGPYYIEEKSENSLTLLSNGYYRAGHPDLEKMKLVTGKPIYSKAKQAYPVSAGYDFLLFNPHKKLSISQRRWITDIFTYLLAQNIDFNNVSLRRLFTVPATLPEKSSSPHFIEPLKVIVSEMNKLFFMKMKKLLSTYQVELLLIEWSDLDYLNNHLLNTDADFIWMYEHYQTIQPFKTIDLLTQCKLQEWYAVLPEARQFLKDTKYKPNDSQKYIAQQFVRNLEKKKLMVPLFENNRVIEMPMNMKNIHQLAYGTLDYHSMVIDS
ncbi:hypothetical protein ERX27_05565 [Macrococcus brunensis]|uniref:ABC transporter substrate-binding protein n=1 Tax=Macrococcus brunensis TaxID=198483 RepID=A0A4R6BDX4_9STAP|nr:ABC transporter substrate-binding protein [Macrococcus brunensis]TDL97928.1 hypothetical protein ERX27_05565 [Macrococcus brunensis]